MGSFQIPVIEHLIWIMTVHLFAWKIAICVYGNNVPKVDFVDL